MHPFDQHKQVMDALTKIKEILSLMNKYRFADDYVTPEELAALLKTNRKTVHNWRQSGLLPYAMLGKKVYFRLSDIEKLFDQEFSRPKKKVSKSKERTKKQTATVKANGWQLKV